jgi:hypothetical protein
MARLKLLVCLGACGTALLASAGAAHADFTVNDLGDASDVTPNGVCDTDGGVDGTPCTLRAAVQEASLNPSLDTITFAVSGTHTLGSSLLIVHPTVIDGNGSGSGAGDTVIAGNDTFPLFLTGVSASNVTLKDVRLRDGGSGSTNGGAAIEFLGNGSLINVTATSNVTSGVTSISGGAVKSAGASNTLTVTDSTISSTTVNSTGANGGGGIYSGGPLVMTNSVVTGNSIAAGSTREGGGIYADGPTQIVGSTISGNSVGGSGRGGGLFESGFNIGARTITNSTFSGNSAGTGGGGGVVSRGPMTVESSTFAGNSNTGSLGDDIQASSGSAAVTVRNSILASTASGSCAEAGGAIDPAVPGHNIDAGTTCGFGSTNGNMSSTDPLITGATLFGGGQLIHIPLFNSPAIDNADPTCGGGLALDQRGLSRPQGGAGKCDIGAYERDYRTLNVTKTGSGTGTVTSTTGTNCGATCSESHVDGTPGLVLTATPAAGSQLGTWSGCDSSTATTCTVDLGNDRSVSVSFDPAPSTGGGGSGDTTTPTPPRKCKKGQKLKKGKCVKKKRKKKK